MTRQLGISDIQRQATTRACSRHQCHTSLVRAKLRDLWPTIAVLMIAVAAVGLLYTVWSSPHRSDLENFGAFALPIVTAAAAAGKIAWSWRKASPATGAARTTEPNQLADQFAEVVESQWTREAGRRQLLVPEPIPVKWRKPSLPIAGSAKAAASTRRLNPLPGLPAITQTQLMKGQISDLHAIYGGLRSGRLVIAGAAGAGKSGAAVLLILAALAYRKQVSDAERPQVPVPVLFTIQGWAPDRQPFQDWLIWQMQENYPLFAGEAGALNAAALIAAGKVSVLLDGLDEMAEELRPIALEALSQQTVFRVVVLTRTAEMASAVSEQGVLEGATAIELQNIDSTTAADYLTRVQLDPPPDGWRQLTDYIRKMPESSLAQALNNPLTLTLVRDTYPKGDDPRDLLDFCNDAQPRVSDVGQAENIVDHLLGRVLGAAYKPRPGEKRPAYDLRTAQRAFINIAAEMNRQYTRDLQLSSLQFWAPQALLDPFRGFNDGGTIGVTAGVIAWLMAGIKTGVVTGIAAGFICWVVGWIELVAIRRSSKFSSFLSRPRNRPMRVLLIPVPGRIRQIKGAWKVLLLGAMAEFLIVTVVTAIVFAGVFGLTGAFPRALVLGLATTVIIGVPDATFNIVIHDRLSGRNISHSLSPLAAWRRSRGSELTSMLLLGFTVAVVLGIVTGVTFGLERGLAAGIFVAVVLAGLAGLSQVLWPIVFVQLARRWHTPVRLVRFLDDARERSVLRTVGSLYQFRHARLQDLLAEQNPDSYVKSGRSAVRPAPRPPA